MAKAKEICKKHNVLLIADEVQVRHVRTYNERGGLESREMRRPLLCVSRASRHAAERKGG